MRKEVMLKEGNPNKDQEMEDVLASILSSKSLMFRGKNLYQYFVGLGRLEQINEEDYNSTDAVCNNAIVVLLAVPSDLHINDICDNGLMFPPILIKKKTGYKLEEYCGGYSKHSQKKVFNIMESYNCNFPGRHIIRSISVKGIYSLYQNDPNMTYDQYLDEIELREEIAAARYQFHNFDYYDPLNKHKDRTGASFGLLVAIGKVNSRLAKYRNATHPTQEELEDTKKAYEEFHDAYYSHSF